MVQCTSRKQDHSRKRVFSLGLQNYKALLSTTVSGDGIYAEYTYNGDKQELYEDVYGKLSNRCIQTNA